MLKRPLRLFLSPVQLADMFRLYCALGGKGYMN